MKTLLRQAMSMVKDRYNYPGIPCPSCKKKGLAMANHPHAIGHKDYTRVRCRYCKKVFDRIKLNAEIDKAGA